MSNDGHASRSAVRRIASVGDSCIDVYAPGSAAVGGNALNVAVGLIRSGVAAAYLGEVGSDDHGRSIIAALNDAGVEADRVAVVNGPSWVAHVVVSADGVARVDWEDPGACGPHVLRTDDIDFLAQFEHVHMANLADRSLAIAAVRTVGISTSYDYGRDWPDPAEILPRILFGSVDGPGALEAGTELARTACERGARLAVAMLGSAGSIVCDGRFVTVQQARPIRPVDTLGAGDRYIAEFLASLLDGTSVGAAMERASDVAAETCMHWAAWPQHSIAPAIGATGR